MDFEYIYSFDRLKVKRRLTRIPFIGFDPNKIKDYFSD